MSNRRNGILRVRRRRRATPLWRSRLAGAGALMLILILGAGGGWWLWSSGHVPRAAERLTWELIALSADLGFRVDEIFVVGRNRTSSKALLQEVGVARGAPILAFDADAARRRIEALPWVLAAAVQRMLPDTVLVHISEHQPLALWQRKGRFDLIDRQGAVIEERDLERFRGLLVVAGEDAPAHVAELLAVLETQPPLMALVEAAVRVGGRRWNLRLKGGIDVRLPEENAAQAWARLAAYERTHRVLARDVDILDLRLPDRLIVRRPARPEKPAPPTGRET